MGNCAGNGSTGRGIPYLGSSVRRRGDDPRAVRAEFRSIDLLIVVHQLANRSFGSGVPDPSCAITRIG